MGHRKKDDPIKQLTTYLADWTVTYGS
jgi:hypothetical protein